MFLNLRFLHAHASGEVTPEILKFFDITLVYHFRFLFHVGHYLWQFDFSFGSLKESVLVGFYLFQFVERAPLIVRSSAPFESARL